MLTRPAEQLFDSYKSSLVTAQSSEEETVIHVDEIAARVAKFYEKIRNIIDYQEEHLLRKGVVLRSLQQGIFLGEQTKALAGALIKKIIRTGHLPNDKIPERKIDDVQHIINNLTWLLEHIRNQDLPPSKKTEISNWLVRITASAIEENLDPPTKDELLSNFMLRTLRNNLIVKGPSTLSEHDVDIQLFVGIQKALLRADDDQLHYRLLKFSYPKWGFLSESELEKIAENIITLRENIILHSQHPLGPIFFNLANHYNTVFYLIGDVLSTQKRSGLSGIKDAFKDSEYLSRSIGSAYKKRYLRAKKRFLRLAFFSVLSIFLSKILIALAIEIPIDKFLVGDYSLTNTIINIIVPPVLLFIILSLIRLPSRKNWPLVMQEVRSVLFQEKAKKYSVTLPKTKSKITRIANHLLYLGISFVIFYAVAKALLVINFSVANIVVFILFTSLVAATGIKIHNRSKSLSLEKPHETFITFLFDTLIMPFATTGRIALAGLNKFMPLVVLVNLIDLPFEVLIEIIENFRDLLRSKKERLY